MLVHLIHCVLQSLDLIPVNYCADAIASLMTSPAALYQTYHLTSPAAYTLDSICTHFAQAGHVLLRQSYDKWVERVRSEAAKSGDKFPLTALLSYFSNGFPSAFTARSAATHTALAKLGLTFPEITEDVIGRYAQFYNDEGTVMNACPTGDSVKKP